MTFIRTTATALLLLLGARTAAGCSLDVGVINSGAWVGGDGRGYDVFDQGTFYQPLSIDVRTLDAGCAFYLTATPGATSGGDGALFGPGQSLRYTIYRDASGGQALKPGPVASLSEVLSGRVSQAAPRASFQIAYSIAPQQILPPGTYTGQITIAAYEGEVGAGLLRAQQQVPITVRIPSITDVSFSQGAFDEAQTATTVAFNLMHQGDLKGATLHARSNTGYRVLLRSDNGGALRNVDASDASTVAYDCFVDGRPVVLSKADAEGVSSSTVTDPLGRAHRIDFRIGSLDRATAGSYKDVVTVTVLSLK